MAHHHIIARHALGLGGAHIIGAEIVQHAGARLLGKNGERAVCKAQHRKRDVPHHIKKPAALVDARVIGARQKSHCVRSGVMHATHWKQAQVLVVGKKSNRKHTRKHGGNGIQRQVENARERVEPTSTAHACNHARGNRYEI